MRGTRIGFALVLAVAALAVTPMMAKDKKKVLVPRLVTDARYVFVGTMQGSTWEPGSVMDPRITSADRKAVADVENELRRWGRYKITLNPQNAELIFVVRAGRRGSVTAGPTIGAGGIGTGVTSEVGPADDMLAVHDASSGIDSPALWRRTKPAGLVAPQLWLLKQFEEEVESSVAAKP